MSLKDFRVLEKLGAGSFATVYKVVRKDDNKLYALKRVKISQMNQREVSDTVNEIRFLASFTHPHIVRFFEAFLEANGRELCIVMEYCGSGDLLAVVERHKRAQNAICEEEIWKYLTSLTSALECLHSHGIVHRDIKCANIFVSEDGSIKLGDLNVSKKIKHGYLHTQIGTPYYMSPEIWANKPYHSASDMWALGCTIYELCTFRPPFQGTSIASLRRSVLAGRYAPLPRKYSRRLCDVVAMLLRMNPSTRPSAQELLKLPEIARFLSTENPPASQIISTIRVPHEIKRLNSNLPRAQYPSLQQNSSASQPVQVPLSRDNAENIPPNVPQKQEEIIAKSVKACQPTVDAAPRGIAFRPHRKIVNPAPAAGRRNKPLGYYQGVAPRQPSAPQHIAIPRPPAGPKPHIN